MPRNAAGVYSLPDTPVVANTVIESADENTTRDDIGSEITNSLDRNGRGPMLAPLRLTDGSLAAPSLAFSSDTDNGLILTATNTWQLIAAGAAVATISAGLFTLVAGVTLSLLSGAITIDPASSLILSSSNGTMLRINQQLNIVNYLAIDPVPTGENVKLSTEGSDSNIGLSFYTKGTASHTFYTNSSPLIQFQILNTNSANRYITVTGANSASAATSNLATISTSTGHSLRVGTGLVVGLGTTTTELEIDAATASSAFLNWNSSHSIKWQLSRPAGLDTLLLSSAAANVLRFDQAGTWYAFNTLLNSKSTDGLFEAINITNSSAGVAAQVRIIATNDATATADMRILGSNFTPTGSFVGNQALFLSSALATGGLMLGVGHGTAPLILATAGFIERVRIDGATGRLVMSASTAAGATMNVPHGTAPAAPSNGDMWTTTAGLFVRINGSTVGPLS